MKKQTIVVLAVVAAVSICALVFVGIWQNEWIYKDVITGEPKTLNEIAAGFFFGTPTEIKKGFSPELREELASHYQVDIPSNAVFIKGYNTNALQDSSVLLVFEIPLSEDLPERSEAMDDYVVGALGLEEAYWTASRESDRMAGEWIEAMGGPWERQVEHKVEPYTSLHYRDDGDRVTVFFNGHRPHTSFS